CPGPDRRTRRLSVPRSDLRRSHWFESSCWTLLARFEMQARDHAGQLSCARWPVPSFSTCAHTVRLLDSLWLCRDAPQLVFVGVEAEVHEVDVRSDRLRPGGQRA